VPHQVAAPTLLAFLATTSLVTAFSPQAERSWWRPLFHLGDGWHVDAFQAWSSLWAPAFVALAVIYLAILLASLARARGADWLALGVGLSGTAATILCASRLRSDRTLMWFGLVHLLLVMSTLASSRSAATAWVTRRSFVLTGAALPALFVWALAPKVPASGACILIGYGSSGVAILLVPVLAAAAAVALLQGKNRAALLLFSAVLVGPPVFAFRWLARVAEPSPLLDHPLVYFLLGDYLASTWWTESFSEALGGNPWASPYLGPLGYTLLVLAALPFIRNRHFAAPNSPAPVS
jgi:hypothetical protein